MRSEWGTVPVAALLLAIVTATPRAQEPASARLSGIPRDLACAPASPASLPTSTLRIMAGREIRKTLFAPGDAIVINAGTAQGLKAGDEFYVRRVVADYFTEPGPSRVSPISVHTAGMVQVVEPQPEVSVAVVTYGCEGLLEGDYLEPFAPQPLPQETVGTIPDYARPGRVLLGDERRQMAGAGDFVVIDQGSDHGVRAGQQLTIFRHVLSDGTGPTTDVGAAMVYVVTPQTSVVRLDRSVDAVYIGDLVAIHR